MARQKVKLFNFHNLNLASRPFRNGLLPWVISLICISASATFLILTFSSYQENKAESVAAAKELQLLEKKAELLKASRPVKKELTQEEKERILAAHLLLERRRFKVTSFFNDLEKIVPADVRISRISVPALYSDDDETLTRMNISVVGRTPAKISEMITAMEKSGNFKGELISEHPPDANNPDGQEYDLRVSYLAKSEK